MNEIIIFNYIMLIFSIVGIAMFILLLFVPAPYGQHINEKWGPTINNKLGWFIMEIPTIIIYLFFYLIGGRKTDIMSIVFLCIWMLHYGQRTFIFPFLIRAKQPMPLTIISFGLMFNGINTYLQARWIYTFSLPYPSNWIISPFFIVGAIIFFSGFFINLHSDRIIRNLRKPGEIDYKIPYGGMFNYVSCPSYFGEITEWAGWAVMTWSLPGLVFVLWTFFNLGPRARSHHKWYLNTFPDYPKNRKALIPYIY
ncbi:MAG: methyltransferase [Candidatus Hodarchaeota archaeon]